ncbi:hypothetical protein PLESTB_000440000 [Pleodorina starrii]|uniref:Uncharacterized protein n=1 Tax=Pleodorina starrii TaxID=330485 RepID=A0A9W6BEQ9_9CHLO|nr:hypothetical protein PLESTB_000440000 [Pleodorina starrii]GLC73943.1 hypothetical protein PLESTF_001440400 [Pleodorina starrii]
MTLTSILCRSAALQKPAAHHPHNNTSLLSPSPSIRRPLPATRSSPSPGIPSLDLLITSRSPRPAALRAASQQEAPTSEAPELLAMPETDLELAAQRVRQLEAEAIAMHDLAQRLNKEGRFEEAQAAYASMHALEDEASQLAARVGCVACVLGEPGQQPEEQASLCNLDPAVLVPYQELHPVLPWPQPAARADSASEQQPQPPQQQLPPLGVGWELLEARALGCVVGSALADAAAMGVHWVYDLAVLDEIERERRQQVLAAASNPPSASSPASASLEHPFSFGLEFTDPPRSPFYAYASGRNSPYGEQTLVLLRSLAEGSGGGGGGGSGEEGSGGADACVSPGLHCGHYAELFSRTFAPESGFDGYRDVSTKGFLRNYGRGFPPPLTGANDAQANCIARLAPLVAAFGASPASPSSSSARAAVASSTVDSAPAATSPSEAPEPSARPSDDDPLLGYVELATRVTQNTDAAVAWASAGAVVLERLLMGSTAEAAVRHVVHDLESPGGRLARYVRDLAPEIAAQLARALELRTTAVPAAVTALGRNCHMPNALQTPLHVVMHVEYLAAQMQTEVEARQEREKETGAEGGGGGGAAGANGGDPWVGGSPQLPAEAYTWGVRLAVREGGCCASRAAYVGACLGAMVAAAPGGGQLVGLPEEWLARYSEAAQVRAWAETVLEARRRATAS